MFVKKTQTEKKTVKKRPWIGQEVISQFDCKFVQTAQYIIFLNKFFAACFDFDFLAHATMEE